MKIKTRLVMASVAVAAAFTAASAEMPDTTFSYIPKIHGDIRTRWEIETRSGEQCFQVRNAVLSVEGQVAPWASYFVYGDLCCRGKIIMLDAWAEVKDRGWSLRMGQFRMPFGVDVGRGPHNYYFANRSFIGNQMCNFRAVGLKAGWGREGFPLSIEAGVFNPAPITEHLTWSRSVAWSTKLTLALSRNWKLYGGYMSVTPYGVRGDMVDATLNFTSGRWTAEAEYIYERYHHGFAKPAHGYVAFGNYAMPLKLRWVNQLSFQARFDGMTRHASLAPGDDGAPSLTDAPRNRVTLGATVSYNRTKYRRIDFRVDYEQYFYHHGVEGPQGQRSKFVAELAFHF